MLIDVANLANVRQIQLNRPEKLNAVSPALASELRDAFLQVRLDNGVSVVVLFGAGRAFCAGADVGSGISESTEGRALLLELYESVGFCPVPVIAAVDGPAVGAGAELATAADIRVAGATSFFRFPGPSLGYPVGMARLVGHVGLGTAKDFVFTSRNVYAEEAVRTGLAQHLTGEGAALERAQQLAGGIAQHDRVTLAELKRQSLNYSSLAAGYERERVALLSGTPVAGGRDD